MSNPTPGVGLDRMVAEKVMGWHYVSYRMGLGDSGYWAVAGTRQSEAESNWYPSTNIGDAWRVVQKLHRIPGNKFFVESHGPMYYLVVFRPPQAKDVRVVQYEGCAETLPHAICIAALASKEPS